MHIPNSTTPPLLIAKIIENLSPRQ